MRMYWWGCHSCLVCLLLACLSQHLWEQPASYVWGPRHRSRRCAWRLAGLHRSTAGPGAPDRSRPPRSPTGVHRTGASHPDGKEKVKAFIACHCWQEMSCQHVFQSSDPPVEQRTAAGLVVLSWWWHTTIVARFLGRHHKTGSFSLGSYWPVKTCQTEKPEKNHPGKSG